MGAEARGQQPGLPWTTTVDGRLGHGYHSRQHLTRKSREDCIGCIGFANDTTSVGEAEEMRYAEPLLQQTMRDWKEKVHPGKTEGLRLQSWTRAETDVRFKGEQAGVRHVGGLLQETRSAGGS